MKRLKILLTGVSLFATQCLAGSVSNVSGTLDVTIVDPDPTIYPHFVCASGCNSGSNTGAMSQSGVWTVGVDNFPASQAVTGSVTVPGVATSANQATLNADGGSLAHITNLPAVQAIGGSVAITNLPTSQSVTGTVSVGNFPATQTINGAVSVLGVATAANQPVLSGDGGGLAHVTNWPSSQPVSGAVSISNLPPVQAVSGTINVGNLPATQPISGTVSIGASTAFGTAGSPSLSVQTVQGVSGGTTLGVSQADGADTTMGSKSDAANATGAASVVSILKQLHLDSIGSLPPGSSNIGTINIGYQTVFNTPIVSMNMESGRIFKPSQGQLTSAYVVSTVAGYFLLMNSATIPPDGAVTPQECIPVSANVPTGVAFSGLPPEAYSVGITAVFSTTGCFTKTASATAYFHGAVQ